MPAAWRSPGSAAVATALGRPDFVVDPSLLPTSYARRFRYAVEALDDFVGALMARKRREPPGDDFLSLLLSAHDAHGASRSTTGRSATRSSPCSSPATRRRPAR